ncbi:sensor histidine kinase [Massilia genomosp. 1]|uniref:histidine kinase n=1 Tax=Massilia genomosp. 1 TaxID=2609280 RepID=A0ABX0MKM2_9BURK|nr:HAMP domain-containing sensor histidine kinase [Massilia genomosp. 1]NHZ63345.1 HAMP domain-containing protein [Massilia genomosp. 1]
MHQHFHSLGRRIVRAYLLFSLGTCILFSIAAAIVVEGIESRLVDERLKDIAAWASPRHAGRLPVEMPAGVSFHHGPSIPQSLRNLPAGVHDVTVDGIGLHVFAGRDASGPFVVVDHASDYEEVELAVYSLLLVGLVVFIAMSLLLGRFVGQRVVGPIAELSAAVAERRGELPLQDNQDELGVLARAFAGHTAELQVFLERERSFTGDVSHELRTPLTVIAGAAEILVEATHGQAQLHAPAERIVRAAKDAADSVGILLLLARSPDLIESEPISMAQLAREEVARYQGLLGDKPLVLTFGGGDDFVVHAPLRLLSAALGNLIRNACLYTDEGRITVFLEASTIVVSDTGHGLPAAVLSILNDPAASARTRGSEGTGLGLALVKRICRFMHAEFLVSSVAGGGTCCYIRFAGDLTKN